MTKLLDSLAKEPIRVSAARGRILFSCEANHGCPNRVRRAGRRCAECSDDRDVNLVFLHPQSWPYLHLPLKWGHA